MEKWYDICGFLGQQFQSYLTYWLRPNRQSRHSSWHWFEMWNHMTCDVEWNSDLSARAHYSWISAFQSIWSHGSGACVALLMSPRAASTQPGAREWIVPPLGRLWSAPHLTIDRTRSLLHHNSRPRPNCANEASQLVREHTEFLFISFERCQCADAFDVHDSARLWLGSHRSHNLISDGRAERCRVHLELLLLL